FLYFVDHGDPDLLEAVRKGRTLEFSDFHASGTPPDPGSVETFKTATLDWLTVEEEGERSQQATLRRFYRQLIKVRKQCQIMTPSYPEDLTVEHTDHVLYYRRTLASGDLLCLMNFSQQPEKVELPLGTKVWHQQINSADAQWSASSSADQASDATGPLPETLSASSPSTLVLSPLSIALYQAESSA
ncbi:MAG: DUF3459 domain-containing protein, partial [Phormidesmis sp.]